MVGQMFDYLYVQGYLAALQDVQTTIADIQEDLKLHKRKQCAKTYKAIIDCMIENRAILREEPDAFVRCNDNAKNGYEVYITDRGVYDPHTRGIKKGE